jgi:hypothetical protein
MPYIHIDIDSAEWASGVSLHRPAAAYQNQDIIRFKISSDRRHEGEGIAWLVKSSPSR